MSLLKRESLLSLSFFIALKMTELNVPIVYCKLLYLLDKNSIKLKKVINNKKRKRKRIYSYRLLVQTTKKRKDKFL